MKTVPYFAKLFTEIERLPGKFKSEEIEEVFLLMSVQRPGGQHHFHAYVPKSLDLSIFHDAARYYLKMKNPVATSVNPTFKSVHFMSKLALGDALTMTAGIRDFKAAFPEVKVRVTSTAPRVWDNNPYIDQGIEDPEQTIKVGTGWLTNASNRLNLHMCNAYRVSIQNETGLAFDQGPIRPDIWLSEEEYQAEPIIPGPYWVIILGGELGWPLKMYPIDRWQKVVDSLPEITFVQMGAAEHTIAHGKLANNKGNVIDYVGKTQDPKTGIRDLFKIFLHSQGSIGLVSLHMHLTAAFNNPCVVVAGAREPSWFTHYLGHQYVQTNGCLPCANEKACWHCGLEACGNLMPDGKTPKCVDIISPEEIRNAILKYYHGGRLEFGKKIPNTFFRNVSKGQAQTKQVVVSGASISQEGWDALNKYCTEHSPNRILEFGPGLSTRLFKKHADVVHSIEEEPEKYNIGLDTIVPKPDGRYDFAFIDGPKSRWAGDRGDIKNFSRYASVQTAINHTDCIILHNALRESERRLAGELLSGWNANDLRVDRGMVVYTRATHPAGDGGNPQGDGHRDTPRTVAKASGQKGLVRVLTSCRGYGGSEKSTLMLMRMFSEKGYNVELIPWNGKIGGPYGKAIPEGVKIAQDLKGECDLLLYYVTDTVYFPEMENPEFDEIMLNLKAGRKAMCINYRIGHLRKKEWAKGWDLYMFLCSQKRDEWMKIVPDATTAVLAPPTDLTEFFKIPNRRTEKHAHLIRHNAQGDAKWPKDINDFVESAWQVDKKIEWSCMPAASFLMNDARIHKFEKNQEPIPQFLSRGNCFIYNLPDGYQDQGPRVIMEAMATGLPVIADNRWGAKDRVNEETGWLCDNPRDYIEALRDIKRTPSVLKNKGLNARKFARDVFDPYKWVNSITGL